MCVTHLSCSLYIASLMKGPQSLSLFSVGFPLANYSGPSHPSTSMITQCVHNSLLYVTSFCFEE